MTTSYGILATISLQHEYYADGRCPDFDITPTAATAKALKGAGILTKMLGEALILLVKLNDAGAVLVDIPHNLRMSFYLKLNNASFVNYTNVPFQATSIFYCSNLPQTKVGTTLYLNENVPNYSNAKAYVIGDLVRAGATDIFEAIKPMAAGTHTTTDANFWKKRSNNQYLHSGDLLDLNDGRLLLQTAPAKLFNIAVFGFNEGSKAFDIPVFQQEQRFIGEQATLNIDLVNLSPAKYKVDVNGEEHYCYVDGEASYTRVFGVVELFNIFEMPSDFSLLDAGKKPRGIEMVIRFANRLTKWKYILRSTLATGVEIPAIPGAFIDGTTDNVFVSKNPMALQQQVLKTIQLMNGPAILLNRLPNPQPDRMATDLDGDGNKYFCSEIYVNF